MYYGKRIIHIVACDHEGGIGGDNQMLWNFKEDFKHFRESTLGHSLIMGRKTIESLPKNLDRRLVVGVSKTKSNCNGVAMFNLETAIEVAFQNSKLLNTDCIFIAGGAEIYKKTQGMVDEVWMTDVDGHFENADAFYEFPSGDFVKRQGPMHLCDDGFGSGQYLLKFNKYHRIGLDDKDC